MNTSPCLPPGRLLLISSFQTILDIHQYPTNTPPKRRDCALGGRSLGNEENRLFTTNLTLTEMEFGQIKNKIKRYLPFKCIQIVNEMMGGQTFCRQMRRHMFLRLQLEEMPGRSSVAWDSDHKQSSFALIRPEDGQIIIIKIAYSWNFLPRWY